MSPAAPITARTLALGALAAAVATALASVALAAFYPSAYLDADLLSYLVYWRQLAAGEPVPFGYTVPKVLPVLVVGPLGDPRLALALSIAIAAVGGALVFAIAARAFGLVAAVLAAVLYVLDPLRGVLTLRSSVDLWVGVALLGAIHAIGGGRALLAGALVLVAALGKPVAAACGLAVLLAPRASWARRLVAAALPALALPAAAMLAAALDGRGELASILVLPDQHERFVHVAQAQASGVGAALRLVAEWFGGTLFLRSWPLAAIGAALCVASTLRRAADESRRRMRAALLAVPLLLAAGYLTVAVREPLVVFTRFFWPVALLATVLAGFAAATLAANSPGPRWVARAVVVVLASVLLADRWDDHRWRARLMLAPFESHAALAGGAVDAIAAGAACAGPALVPLAYLPLAAWRAPDKLARGEICAVEDWADGRGCAEPNCVLFMPAAPTTERAREAMTRLVHGAYVVEIGDEHGALVRSDRG